MPLTVHFKRPADWQTAIRIHYWETSPADPPTTWPGVAMTAAGQDLAAADSAASPKRRRHLVFQDSAPLGLGVVAVGVNR